jgi:RNA polymerase sigma factor (sigma-70 family)
MPTSSMGDVIQQIRRSVVLSEGGGLTDGQLLGQFLDGRDADAFAALVKRHAPMVWGVCRRLLSYHDAEDAFQATFLVLVRKAAAVRPRELLANWLYGVAFRTARRSRATAAKRRGREKQVSPMPEPAVAEPELCTDLRPLLDQELSRLPDRYRTVIVLCDLEGKTREQAARQLGCPEGTVASRLARGRTILGRRLARHGLAVSGGTLAVVLAPEAGAAAPASVVSTTLKAASLAATGRVTAGVISTKASALTTGVMRTMRLNKFKAVLVVVVATALGLGGTSHRCRTAMAQHDKGASKEAAGRKAPSRIVVTADIEVDGKRDILLLSIDPQTGAWKKLSGTEVRHPRVSPDGQTVVFHRGDAIWNCDTGGSDNPGKIAEYAAAKVEGVGPPVWSRDGKHFYLSTFHTRLGGEITVAETWRYDANGRNPVKQLVPDSDDVLDVSPDGKHFLTIRLRYALADRIRHGFNHTEVRVLAPDGKESWLLSEGAAVHRDARFSPDGRRAVYSEIVFKKGQNLYVVHSDGKQRQKIYSEVGTCIQGCCWSPDGKQIAAILYDWDGQGGLQGNSSRWRLEVMDADGQNRREVALKGNVRMLWEPDWHVVGK